MMMSETTNSTTVYGQLVIALNLPTQWRSRGGVKWRHLSRSASTHFIQPFKSAVLSLHLDQNMPKKAYFWKKCCKIAAVSSPQIPFGFRHLGTPPQNTSIVTFAYCWSFRRERN